MSLPPEIPTRYAEEDVGYMSVRPVVNQTFGLQELADMVVSVVGKDAVRVQQIFRAGTLVYNGYRYWWNPLPADTPEIEALLLSFPEDEPSRPFQAQVTPSTAIADVGNFAEIRSATTGSVLPSGRMSASVDIVGS